MSIFKDCDIRGIFGTEFRQTDALLIGKAVGTILRGREILLCGDVRLSTESLKSALAQGLVECGAKVIDIGIGPTPMAYFAKSKFCLNTYGLAMVTASHNPPEYNGVKLMLGDMPIHPEMLEEIRRIAESERFVEGTGSLERTNVQERYRTFLQTMGFGSHKKVVVDCGNGAESLLAPEVLRAAGYQVTELFCEPDGRFPNRNPNPAVYSNLTDLCKQVPLCGADFGVAFDGDGDRVVFVDDQGQVVPSEKTLVLLIREIAKKRSF